MNNPPSSTAPWSREAPLPPWQVGPARWTFCNPLIMGVLNATPDSFSDGGEYLELKAALRRGEQLLQEGAHLIDLGGASSHPQAPPVSIQEELDRIMPIVERLVGEFPLPLSIDTQQPAVAEACLAAGAHFINDVSGLATAEMARSTARHQAPLVIMYNTLTRPRPPGIPLWADMCAFFQEKTAQAQAVGVERILLDPGYGFGKSLAENMALLHGLNRLQVLRQPLLVCTSRKGSLGRISGEKHPAQRWPATLASSLYAVQQGAHMVRVHDVKAMAQALRTWRAIQAASAEI